MKEKPRDINIPLLNKAFAKRVSVEGIIIAISTLIAFHIGLSTGDTMTASTMAFSTLCLARLFHGFNSRSGQSLFKIGVFSNKYLWYAVIAGVLLLHLVLLLPPLMSVFEIADLNKAQFGTIYILSLIPLVFIQLYRVIFSKQMNK